MISSCYIFVNIIFNIKFLIYKILSMCSCNLLVLIYKADICIIKKKTRIVTNITHKMNKRIDKTEGNKV